MLPSEMPLTAAYEALRRGRMSRREFAVRAAALGISAPVTLCLVNSAGKRGVSAQAPPPERPAYGTHDQVRGAGGELRVRQWFAPNNAVAHLTGFPPSEAQVSSLILEPLLSYAFDGSLLPTLVTQVPTKENGGLSDDLTTVTLDLRDDVLWSDGEPFTAEDVVWTWQWVTDESNQAITRWQWDQIRTVEVIGPTKVELTYAKPALAWFAPLAGAFQGSILPRHIWRNGDKDAANAEFGTNPIGTGPYRIETFVPGDHIICSINERYREPNKPYFETVRFQGGGDSASDAQAVLQSGDWDVAASLTLKPEMLLEMEAAGGKAQLVAGLPVHVERIEFNFSDPNREVEGERSSLRAPHPFLTDRTVRQAMSMAIDRESIIEEVFSGGEFVSVGRNILTGIPLLESPTTSSEFDLEGANNLLDEAGWVRAGNARTKNGIELAVSYYTLVVDMNAQLMRFRPEIQAAVKRGWETIGIQVQLGQVSGDEFFDASAENFLSYKHFYRDIQMYANGPAFPVPDGYFVDWYAGPEQSNVAQLANEWQGGNVQRYVNREFDVLFEESITTTNPEHAAELFVRMNDLIVGEYVVIPLHARSEQLYALSNRLSVENVAPSSWEPLFWNIANWRAVDNQVT